MDIASHNMPHLGILTSSSNSAQDRSTVDGPFVLKLSQANADVESETEGGPGDRSRRLL